MGKQSFKSYRIIIIILFVNLKQQMAFCYGVYLCVVLLCCCCGYILFLYNLFLVLVRSTLIHVFNSSASL